MTFALAAAGTGGHVFPALAVGEALIEKGVDREDILFFGGDRMEKATVPSAGFRFVELEIRGFRRSLSLANFKVVGLVAKARAKAISTIRQNDIKAITTFGGYVAGPVAMAAKATKIPLLLHEQNAIAGLANSIIVRWASDVFVAFEQAQQKLGGRLASASKNTKTSPFATFVPSFRPRPGMPPFTTLQPKDFAISTVRSFEAASATIISRSFIPCLLTERSTTGRYSSSLSVGMITLIIYQAQREHVSSSNVLSPFLIPREDRALETLLPTLQFSCSCRPYLSLRD